MSTAPPQGELALACEALRVLYLSGDDTQRSEANAWLENFQRREEAWVVADQMIRRPDLGIHALYFAAHTLHTKIMRDFAQLPVSSHNSLEQSILQLLLQFREGPAEVRTQLCLALANLIIHMGTWHDPITDVVRLFSGNNDGPSALLLVDFLKVLPEEVMNRRNVVERDRRRRVHGYMRNCAPAFIDLMLRYLQGSNNNVNIIERIFQCVHSWLRSDVVPLEAFINSSLLQLTFEALKKEQLFDVAVDVTIEVIDLTGDTKNKQVMVAILGQLLSQRQTYYTAVHNEDLDTARGYARLYVEASESYLPMLVDDPAQAKDLLEVLLQCLAHPELEIAQMSFNFFYRAAQFIADKDNSANCHAIFDPFFVQSIDVIIGQLSYPLDSENWTAERKDDFSGFRHHVGDTLKDCCSVVGSEACLRQVLQRLEIELARNASWQSIEAVLFAMRSLAREVITQLEKARPGTNANEIQSMVPIMNVILSNRILDHPKIRYTITLILGHYAPWSKLHPEVVPVQAKYIFDGFAHQDVAPAAALALKQLTQSCSHLISGFVDALLDFQQSQNNTLRAEDQLEFSEAIVNIVESLPENVIQQYWVRFATPILQGLQQVLYADPSPPLSEIKTLLTSLIDRLRVCFRQSRSRVPKVSPNTSSTHLASLAFVTAQAPPTPLVPIVTQAWPIFEGIFQRFGAVPTVMKSLCRCWRAIVICVGVGFLPHLDSLISHLTMGYANYKHSEYLYLAFVLLRTFGHIQELQDRFVHMVTNLSAPTFALLSANPKEAFNQDYDVVQDYFSIIEQCGRVSPTLLVVAKAAPNGPELLPTVIMCAVACLNMTTLDESIAATLHMLEALLYAAYNNEHHLREYEQFMATLVPVLNNNGQELVSALMNGVVKHFSQVRVDQVSTMLSLLFKVRTEETPTWLGIALQNLPPTVSQEDRGDLMSILLKRGDLQPILRNINYENAERDANNLSSHK